MNRAIRVTFSRRDRQEIDSTQRIRPKHGVVWWCFVEAIPAIGEAILCMDHSRKVLNKVWLSPDECELVLQIGEAE